MNAATLTLSSTYTNHVEILSELVLNDLTTLTLSISGLSEDAIPNYLKIDWGDGESHYADNRIYRNYRVESILTEVLQFKVSSILSNNYEHIYYPSSTSLYKNLSAQVYVSYMNGDYAWFIQPISIRSNDYFESIYDLKLLNTTILPISSNPKEHTLITSLDGQIIQLRG